MNRRIAPTIVKALAVPVATGLSVSSKMEHGGDVRLNPAGAASSNETNVISNGTHGEAARCAAVESFSGLHAQFTRAL